MFDCWGKKAVVFIDGLRGVFIVLFSICKALIIIILCIYLLNT